MAAPLSISIKFSETAVKMLPPSGASLNFPSHAISQQSLMRGDKLRMPGIPDCPWFVITQRYWELGAEQATLTIWLDVPED